MMTLDDAWSWYSRTRSQLKMFGRVGGKYWDGLDWEKGLIGRDERLKLVESSTIYRDSEFCLEHLDDFAVLILFSVFESIVRDRALSDVQDERSRTNHELVGRILDDAIDGIEQGSFYRVLDVFKGKGPDLVEQVNQVRKYRNWVAHGRRAEQPEAVDPETAFRRLKRFLDEFMGPTA